MKDKKTNNPSQDYTNKQGIDWYKQAQKKKELAIVKAAEWTYNYCIVIEGLEVKDNKLYIIGSTFKNGLLFDKNVRYDAYREYQYYIGSNRQDIIDYYKINAPTLPKEDPIEKNPDYVVILKTVDALVKEEIGPYRGMGFCHLYWSHKKKILKEYFDIDWKSPAELNPDIIFD